MKRAEDVEGSAVNVRIKIAALWASMLFVFVYVDLFSTYRADFRADLDGGTINGFTVNQTFLLATTAFVGVPSLMVFLTVVLPPRINRIANIALSGFYAPIILGGAIGEWNYYLLGSAIEVVQLAGVGYYAWTWPRDRRVELSAPSALDPDDARASNLSARNRRR